MDEKVCQSDCLENVAQPVVQLHLDRQRSARRLSRYVKGWSSLVGSPEQMLAELRRTVGGPDADRSFAAVAAKGLRHPDIHRLVGARQAVCRCN